MAKLPYLDAENRTNAPHLVILGAGASRAVAPDGDLNGRMLPVMNDLVQVTGINTVLDQNGVNWKGRNFEVLYEEMVSNTLLEPLVVQIENHIREYFSDIRIPTPATVYDRLLLSLRRKDVVATFNWDPMLAQAFIRNRVVGSLPNILFLHGNVSIGLCTKHGKKGFMIDPCTQCGELLQPVRLLYPTSTKNYADDPFIKDEWSRFEHSLKNAYMISIFGYSAPVTDVEARRVMLDTWHQNEMNEFGEIEIIDIREKLDIEQSWGKFFVRDHYGLHQQFSNTFIACHPRRSCDAFASASLRLTPLEQTPLPDTDSLATLQEWATHLIREEQTWDSLLQ